MKSRNGFTSTLLAPNLDHAKISLRGGLIPRVYGRINANETKWLIFYDSFHDTKPTLQICDTVLIE